ncbi:VIT domain-containing protein [Hyphomicrobium sp.]|uniref:VIT domain-containing protein n=1 Tax=Hyphomicrobium sp. TaxID=82 RepID=UPI0025BA4C89|nr:VIT domain-containing protein [Hyphomicrobium sp.]MCC7254003.1 VWA domain-containing protein [Hyphomicrobium sp.]
MPSIPALNADDPVSRLIDRSIRRPGHFPVPLIATTYDIAFTGGLAYVTSRRTFRNQEAQTIEATLTFPLPVHAVLYALEARIGGRVVKAVAKDKTAARETYEDAIDRGKTAVLHEELLRGIHMLSVAHVAPGTEIEVTARFALALSWIGGRAMLRIPTTVGDVYGVSGLSDCDELVHGGPVTAAALTVACEPGTTARIGGTEISGPTRVPLDRPISVEVAGWTAREIRGRTAAGQPFGLSIAPVPEGDAALDAAILIDHSGSMVEPCASTARLSKHAAVVLGLGEVARALKSADRINLWQFESEAEDLGSAQGSHVGDLIRMLSEPRGGTEIGHAIHACLSERGARDIVLVTDGKSYALDVQELARTGARFSVVLIGEDSLEANVGHLAILTGGEIFVADGTDVATALKQVLASLRSAPRPEATAGAHLALARRGGMELVATPMPAADAAADDGAARAAGALVAGLRLASLTAQEAADLAVSEGLVTHLTSLVLVDEAGEAQAGLPAMRKVALASPATQIMAAASARMHFGGAPDTMLYCLDFDDEPRQSQSVCYSRAMTPTGPAPARSGRDETMFAIGAPADRPLKASRSARPDEAESPSPESRESQAPQLTKLPRRIDWRNEGQRLVEGILIGLPNDVADAIDAAARVGVVKRAAKKLGVSARVLVIGLLARVVSGRDRHAERVYRAILARAKTQDIAHAAERLGLSSAFSG